MSRPNVLFIMADQLGSGMLGCYGNPVVRTPNIDGLASGGILCNSNYVQNPVCMPSRTSMFTGRYPSVCGTRINGIPLRESEITLPQALGWGGYRTFAAGKLHFRRQLNSFNFADGSRPEHEGTRPYYGFGEYRLSDDNRVGPYLRWIEKEHPQYADAIRGTQKKLLGNTWDCWVGEYPAELHQTNWVADQTIDFINRQDDSQPFFAFCSFADPHHPFNPPQPYASMYDDAELPPLLKGDGEPDNFPATVRGFLNRPNFIGDYTQDDWDMVRRLAYGMVSLIDDAVGRVLAALAERGMLEDTIVVFTSDHGEMLGEHHLLYKGDFHFDQLIRTPMIWHCAGRWTGGRRIDGLTQSMDIMPTLLDMCGAVTPDAVQGQSQQSLLDGSTTAGRPWVLTENLNYAWTADSPADTPVDTNTLVTDRWKITVRDDGDTGQLFDRVEDPDELRNRWDDADCRDVRAELTEQMVRCMSRCREHDWRREATW